MVKLETATCHALETVSRCVEEPGLCSSQTLRQAVEVAEVQMEMVAMEITEIMVETEAAETVVVMAATGEMEEMVEAETVETMVGTEAAGTVVAMEEMEAVEEMEAMGEMMATETMETMVETVAVETMVVMEAMEDKETTQTTVVAEATEVMEKMEETNPRSVPSRRLSSQRMDLRWRHNLRPEVALSRLSSATQTSASVLTRRMESGQRESCKSRLGRNMIVNPRPHDA